MMNVQLILTKQRKKVKLNLRVWKSNTFNYEYRYFKIVFEVKSPPCPLSPTPQHILFKI